MHLIIVAICLTAFSGTAQAQKVGAKTNVGSP